ncbi:MAG: site-specific integrase [Alistipes sp.]|nr:site-specific integrase [Eggerthellaceae bacterium]MBQ9137561.1 site-specific integrase [Alistipes sp.]MBQ9137568.1 site-specific integrase [Alistipes sp.]
MAKGDGQIRQRVKDGKPAKDAQGRFIWDITVSLGFDPVAKRYPRKTVTVHGTKADARRKRDELLRIIEGGIDLKASETLFADYAAQWLERRKHDGTLGKNTIKSDGYTVGVLCKYLGGVAIADITPSMVDSLLVKAKEDRGISGSTLRRFYITLNQILKQAEMHELIRRNPCSRVKAPRPNNNTRDSLTASEGARLLRCIAQAEEQAYIEEAEKEERQTERGNLFARTYLRGLAPIACTMAARIGLATGARRGEVLALCWGAIDLEEGTLAILQSVTERGEVKQPKTSAGRRIVSIDAATVSALKRWKQYQARELRKLGIKQNGSTPAISDSKGTFLIPSNFSRWWRSFTAENGFEGLCFHSLRHTQATQLLANGVDLRTVQGRLGHASASLTLGLYSHFVPQNDSKAAALIGDIFGSSEGEKGRIVEVKAG